MAFLQLAKEVSKCKVCLNMLAVPHRIDSECLENDSHGLETGQPYVNLWNLWHGNLDADIMVIGQDFGVRENATSFIKKQKSKNYTNTTDKALRDLFKETFDIDVDDENASLFFTNMANCYRKQKSTGGMHCGWLPICANKYMGRLIQIVQPKMIIVLGQTAFDAMFCLEGLTVECNNPDEKATNIFGNVIQYEYQIKLNDSAIYVFPVYHPGANSKRNRSIEEQKQDWKRMKSYYKRG